MNWLDYVLIVIIGFSALMSARRGLSREIIGLAGMVLALVMGMWFYRMAGALVAPYVKSDGVANLLGFLMVGAAVLICTGIVGKVVSGFLRTVGLSFLDRLTGAAFGAVRGTLIAISLVTALTAFGPWVESKTVSEAVVHSQIAPWVLDASHIVVAVAPKDLKQDFEKQYTRLKTAVRDR